MLILFEILEIVDMTIKLSQNFIKEKQLKKLSKENMRKKNNK